MRRQILFVGIVFFVLACTQTMAQDAKVGDLVAAAKTYLRKKYNNIALDNSDYVIREFTGDWCISILPKHLDDKDGSNYTLGGDYVVIMKKGTLDLVEIMERQ